MANIITWYGQRTATICKWHEFLVFLWNEREYSRFANTLRIFVWADAECMRALMEEKCILISMRNKSSYFFCALQETGTSICSRFRSIHIIAKNINESPMVEVDTYTNMINEIRETIHSQFLCQTPYCIFRSFKWCSYSNLSIPNTTTEDKFRKEKQSTCVF